MNALAFALLLPAWTPPSFDPAVHNLGTITLTEAERLQGRQCVFAFEVATAAVEVEGFLVFSVERNDDLERTVQLAPWIAPPRSGRHVLIGELRVIEQLGGTEVRLVDARAIGVE